jgi:hypothetical protein
LIPKRVTILGNGLSRKLVPLHKIPTTIWGCNALYRDYSPSLLFCIDRRMILEIARAKYKGEVVYRPWRGFAHPPSNFTPFICSGCSGETAIRYALEQNYSHIDLIGFDMQEGHIQNVYTNTENYGTHRDYQPTFPSLKNYLPTVQDAKIRRIVAKNYGKPIKGIVNISMEEYLKELG